MVYKYVFLFIFCVFMQSCVDLVPSKEYINQNYPEIVNMTESELYMLRLSEDVKRSDIYYITVNRIYKNGSSVVPVGNDKYRNLYKLIISFDENCVNKIKDSEYIIYDNDVHSIIMRKNMVDRFIKDVSASFIFTESDIENFLKNIKNSKYASCLLLDSQGKISPVLENELPWYDGKLENKYSYCNHLLSPSVDPIRIVK